MQYKIILLTLLFMQTTLNSPASAATPLLLAATTQTQDATPNDTSNPTSLNTGSTIENESSYKRMHGTDRTTDATPSSREENSQMNTPSTGAANIDRGGNTNPVPAYGTGSNSPTTSSR